MSKSTFTLALAAALVCSLSARGEIEVTPLPEAEVPTIAAPADSLLTEVLPKPVSVVDSLLTAYIDSYDITTPEVRLPQYFFMPAVYDSYLFLDSDNLDTKPLSGDPAMQWVEEASNASRRMQAMQQNFFFTHPEMVQYNVKMLPDAPKKYQAVVNLEDHTIEITEIPTLQASQATSTMQATEIKKRHWMRVFNASLQFSQAYVSPNWYQGGNNSLNSLGQLYYNVKLNKEYHPNLLFESTFSYKLGLTTTQAESIHPYTISDDLFQINSTFGYKAFKRWYYSLTGQFKTQMLNSYTGETWNLRSAFLSPADLTLGLGMTYNFANDKVTLDASISPLSYNMNVCISNNPTLDKSGFGIPADKKWTHKFGSTGEVKFTWKIAHNIKYTTRVFGFTDYGRAYADWENNVTFDINRFLTTQVNVNMRYDSATPQTEDSKWQKFQLKELLSLGFAYKFSSL